MNLQGSITELQDTLVKLYVELEHRFIENRLIRDLWNSMAQDVAQQKRSMSAIPHSFWNGLKDEQAKFSEALLHVRHQVVDKKEDFSLIGCFQRAFLFEEPLILRIYAPIIRKLRENWTDQALDFYIMVKAHLARITRVTQAYAGDPVILRKSNQLFQSFEKEVQEPHIVPELKPRKAQAASAAPAPHPVPSKDKHPAKQEKKPAPKKAPALSKHPKAHHARSKPLVEKVALQRRRATR